MVEKILSEVEYEDRKEALKQKTGTHKKLLPFFKQFQPAQVPNLKRILIDKWHLIQNQPLLERLFGWWQFHEFPTDGQKYPGSRAQILANLASQRAVKSRFPSRYFAFSWIPHLILVISWLPRIPFQTLGNYWFLFVINTTTLYAFHDRINDEVLTKFRSVGWSLIYILCLKDGWGRGGGAY